MKNSLEEKFESLKKTGGETPPQQIVSSDILSYVTPVEVVDLPSKGKFYSEGHPLYNKSSVEIRQMTAKDEDVLTNRSFIKKGIVLDKFLESVLLDKSIKANTLFTGDKNAILLASRITGYGEKYDVSVICQDCGARSNRSINLLNSKIEDIDKIDEIYSGGDYIKYLRMENGNFTVELPKSKWAIECKILNGEDEKALMANLENKKRKDPDAEISATDQLHFIIKKVNNLEDPEVIKKSIDFMPVFDAKYLREIYQKLMPNVKIPCRFMCDVCSVDQEVEVPFTQEFFWPK